MQLEILGSKFYKPTFFYSISLRFDSSGARTHHSIRVGGGSSRLISIFDFRFVGINGPALSTWWFKHNLARAAKRPGKALECMNSGGKLSAQKVGWAL
jgi:hypothetical protein